MKKYYMLIIIAFIALKAIAQDTIPNPSFERWTNDTVTTILTTKAYYQNPVGWVTPDSLTLTYGGSAEVTRSANAYLGNYAAQLETQSIAGTFYVPGFVILGKLNIDINTATGNITGGVPFNGRPDSLYGYYQYTPATGTTDSCLAFVFLTTWNTTTNTRDTVAAGIFESGDTVTTYTKFSVPISYYNTTEIPDTLQMGVLSSYKFLSTKHAGSTMLVDDLYFSTDTSATTTGINTITDKGFSVSCYPNPANANLNILISQPQQGMLIKVYDALGKTVLSVNNEGLITSIDVSKLANGTYFYEVLDTNGNSLKTDKFTVVR